MIRDLPGHDLSTKKRALVNKLDQLFAYESRKTTTYGLPEATEAMTELTLTRELQDARNPHAEFLNLVRQSPLNPEQAAIFHRIQDAFARNERVLIYVQVRFPKVKNLTRYANQQPS